MSTCLRQSRQLAGFLKIISSCAIFALPAGAQTPYQFGNPTASEQAYIELMNRARANPAAEGERLAATLDPEVLSAYTYYGVDLDMMRDEFEAISPAPPLAPNAHLAAAARSHSQWMLDFATQSHHQTNPANGPGDRITAAGYDWWTYGENLYAHSKSVWHGHAGFQVDWGPGGPGGMQNGRGHRASIHDPGFREVGVGVIHGTNGPVGPQLVTQDFGDPYDPQSFGTGVAYYDLNSNNFYDIGEGIEGLTVTALGVSHYCKTAVGGGWAFPIPDLAATRLLTFSGLGINEIRSLVVPASTNAKADLKLHYTPPLILAGTSGVTPGAHVTSFTPVGGATGYQRRHWTTAPAPAENCESLANVTTTLTGSYPVLNTSVKSQGASSFRLVNPSNAGTQILELNSTYFGGDTPVLSFMSRLRTTTTSERHRVEVREQGANQWMIVDDQVGGNAQASFSQRVIPLPAMAGKRFQVRFVLAFTSGSYFGNTGNTYGWFIDAITFAGVSSLENMVSETLDGVASSLTTSPGSYLVSVAPIISGIEFPAGQLEFTVVASVAPTFATWAAAIETETGLAPATISGHPNEDYDHDGHSNLVEYAFATSPVAANEPAPHMPAIVPGTDDLVIRYTRDTSLTDISLGAVACPTMSDWRSPGEAGAPVGFTDTVISTDGPFELREARIPAASAASCFMRVRVIRN